ncbi:hypothetical protein QYE76_043875 [Lolium multiflorum]|uniref:Retrotransposon Copia-like N-terminal domain-containing protein n=1 Tax=Lolium multiflorum TaxID=4521 RepID=A0AAD8WVX7_LOLMU|nr:hypothetical protein QYE76_043875 [Lolium multiflorum]
MSLASSSAAATMTNPLAGHSVSEKLTRTNYLVWQSQVLPAVRGARLMGYLDGTTKEPPETIEVDGEKGGKVTVSNPAYEHWITMDQQVLSYLLNTLSMDILLSVTGLETASEVYAAIKVMFSSQSRTRVANLRVALINTKRENLPNSHLYFTKMKSLAEESCKSRRMTISWSCSTDRPTSTTAIRPPPMLLHEDVADHEAMATAATIAAEEDEAVTAAMTAALAAATTVAMIAAVTAAMDARIRAAATAPTTTTGTAAEDVEMVVTVTANVSSAKSARNLAIPHGSVGIGRGR